VERRPRRLIWLVTAAVCAVFASVGCNDDSAGSADGLVIDARRGTVDGVGLGDDLNAVENRFGPGQRGRGTNVSVTPLGAEIAELGLPWIVEPPPYARRLSVDRFVVLRYREMVFDAIERGGGVFNFSVSARGARTTEGVGIGEPLSSVDERYRGVRCDVRNQGTEYGEYPYCTLRLGPNRHLWFGQDPIRSITVSATPLG